LYRVSAIINDVAYRLELPPRTRLHDVFHVGLLKKFVGEPPEAPPKLPLVHHGAVVPEPERVVSARLVRGVRQVLICWACIIGNMGGRRHLHGALPMSRSCGSERIG
jgi:hypothetical protein